MSMAGSMRESVTLQQYEEIDDGAGNTYGDYLDVATVPARIRGMKGSEAVLAGRLEGIQPYIITIRNAGDAAGVTTSWRALNARTSEAFNIRSIIRAERGDYIDLLCETGVAT